jgi:putative aldouronate transport system substrate-binding protein
LLFEAQKKGTSEGLASRLTFHFDKILGFENGTNTGSDAYGLWGQYKLGGSVQIIMEQYLPSDMRGMNIVGIDIPDSYIDYTSVLEAITLQAFTEIIMGADIDNFDKYVQDWLNAGGQAILNDLDALYPQ